MTIAFEGYSKLIHHIAPGTPATWFSTEESEDFYAGVLRRTAVQVECAFGAIVMPSCCVQRYHRISDNESDVSIDAAVQSLYANLIKWMALRREPLAVNHTKSTNSIMGRYKLAAAPVWDEDGELLGMMLLFREPTAPDFSIPDLERTHAACKSLTAKTALHATRTPAQIRRALAENDFILFAQRISPLRKHPRAARFEVLLRMQNADALYAPEAFMATARTGHLMPAIDRWVVRHSLRELQSHGELLGNRNVELCINVDEQSLTDPGFADFVAAELTDCAVPADMLAFEIAEPVTLKEPLAVATFASRVTAAGCKVSLDNFGAGARTMAALRQLPVSSIKIDGSVVRDVTTSFRSEAFIRNVANITAGLEIETVAGRVENEDVREKLQLLGVDYAQGYAVSPPRPVDETLDELEYLRRAGRQPALQEPLLAATA